MEKLMTIFTKNNNREILDKALSELILIEEEHAIQLDAMQTNIANMEKEIETLKKANKRLSDENENENKIVNKTIVR